MANNGFMQKLWNWFDNSFLLFATIFFVAFIPLYPKIPLTDLIPGYIVRLRLEDFFVAAAAAWWGIQVLRKKIHWRTPLTAAIGGYVLIGLISNLSGMFLTQTIPTTFVHVGKSALHWARYIQYFSLFFIAYSGVKTRAQGLLAVSTSILTVVLVGIYGYGQKYWYWPLYSTMNREFSKGLRLVLSPYGRVQSTFAGHYDLGAYLVIVIPFALALFFVLGRRELLPSWIKTRWIRPLRIVSFLAWFSGLWLLVMSASRAAFVGYLAGLGLVLLIWAWKIKDWRWFLTRSIGFFLFSTIMLVFVGDLRTRFAQLIDQNKYPRVHTAYHTVNDYANNPQKFLAFVGVNVEVSDEQKSLQQLEAELNEQGMTLSDTQPLPRPSDVTVDVPLKEFDLDDPAATLAANVIRQGDKLVQQQTFSDCALKRSLSLCIRLETLWPQAIQGFLKNPVVGSGYATLTKSQVEQFTEADSTDNNFLRTLGENGVVGFAFFYGAIGLSMWFSWRMAFDSSDTVLSSFGIAAFAGAVGLLLNAVYIDVFAASKVAYTFWLMQGVVLAVGVKEGVIAPKFAFERAKQSEELAQISALLQKMESKRTEKYQDSHYLSAAKQSQKRRKPKKNVRHV